MSRATRRKYLKTLQVVACLFACVFRKKKKRIIVRRYRTRPIFRRKKLGSYALFIDMVKKDHESFVKNYRMTPSRFLDLLKRVSPFLRTPDESRRKPIPKWTKLAVTVSYLASGATQQTLAFGWRIGKK